MNTNDRMTARPAGWEVTVPPGRYFLGDPCYAVPADLWDALLESCGLFGLEDGGGPVGHVEGYDVLAFSTAYGDGYYPDQWGHHFAVDAGVIGLTPMGLVRETEYESSLVAGSGLGMIVEFHQPTTCTDDGHGRLTFGHYTINTDDPEEG